MEKSPTVQKFKSTSKFVFNPNYGIWNWIFRIILQKKNLFSCYSPTRWSRISFSRVTNCWHSCRTFISNYDSWNWWNVDKCQVIALICDGGGAPWSMAHLCMYQLQTYIEYLLIQQERLDSSITGEIPLPSQNNKLKRAFEELEIRHMTSYKYIQSPWLGWENENSWSYCFMVQKRFMIIWMFPTNSN